MSVQFEQITLGLEAGYLASGRPRTQLPHQGQSTEANAEILDGHAEWASRVVSGAQNERIATGGWVVSLGKLSGSRLSERGRQCIYKVSVWALRGEAMHFCVGIERQVLSSFPTSR